MFDLPRTWPATTRHREAEGSSYYRHFYMGLLREDGTPKRALQHFHEYTPALGLCQWLHFEDHRLEATARWLDELGVRYLRTGLSWADSHRPDAEAWFDRQMQALEPYERDAHVSASRRNRAGFGPTTRARRKGPTSMPLSALK